MKSGNNFSTKENPNPRGFKYIGDKREILLINLSDLISEGIGKLDDSFFENPESITELHYFQKEIWNDDFVIDKNLLSNLPNLETLSITNITLKDGDIDFVTSNLNLQNLQIHSSEYSGVYSLSSKIILPKLRKVDFWICTLDEQNSLLSLLPKKNLGSLTIVSEFNFTVAELNEFENLHTLAILISPFPDYKKLSNLTLNKLETLALPAIHSEEDPPNDVNEDLLPKKGFPEIKLQLPNLKILHFAIDYDYFPRSYIEGCPKLELLEVFDNRLASYSVHLDVKILDLPNLRYLSIPDLIYLPTKENLLQIRNHPRVISGEILLSQTEEEDFGPPEDLKEDYDDLMSSMVYPFIL